MIDNANDSKEIHDPIQNNHNNNNNNNNCINHDENVDINVNNNNSIIDISNNKNDNDYNVNNNNNNTNNMCTFNNEIDNNNNINTNTNDITNDVTNDVIHNNTNKNDNIDINNIHNNIDGKETNKINNKNDVDVNEKKYINNMNNTNNDSNANINNNNTNNNIHHLNNNNNNNMINNDIKDNNQAKKIHDQITIDHSNSHNDNHIMVTMFSAAVEKLVGSFTSVLANIVGPRNTPSSIENKTSTVGDVVVSNVSPKVVHSDASNKPRNDSHVNEMSDTTRAKIPAVIPHEAHIPHVGSHDALVLTRAHHAGYGLITNDQTCEAIQHGMYRSPSGVSFIQEPHFQRMRAQYMETLEGSRLNARIARETQNREYEAKRREDDALRREDELRHREGILRYDLSELQLRHACAHSFKY